MDLPLVFDMDKALEGGDPFGLDRIVQGLE